MVIGLVRVFADGGDLLPVRFRPAARPIPLPRSDGVTT